MGSASDGPKLFHSVDTNPIADQLHYIADSLFKISISFILFLGCISPIYLVTRRLYQIAAVRLGNGPTPMVPLRLQLEKTNTQNEELLFISNEHRLAFPKSAVFDIFDTTCREI